MLYLFVNDPFDERNQLHPHGYLSIDERGPHCDVDGDYHRGRDALPDEYALPQTALRGMQ
jgi:hypothetical protein